MTTKFKVDWPEAKCGPWKIERFTVQENNIELIRLALSGRSIPPGTYTRLVHDSRGVIMSDTPAEIYDMVHAIHRAFGRVLVHGLGLGIYAMSVASKEEVNHVDVVEIDQDVIDLVGPHLKAKFGERISITRADAYTHSWPKGTRWDYAWHDIWDSICVDNLEEMTKLHRKYGSRVYLQDSWCRGLCRSYRRQETKWKLRA